MLKAFPLAIWPIEKSTGTPRISLIRISLSIIMFTGKNDPENHFPGKETLVLSNKFIEIISRFPI